MAATEFTAREVELNQRCAAMAFVDGLCKALMPKREAYEFPMPAVHSIGADDAALYCQEQCIQIDREDKATFFAECRAKLDASLARIAASDDITRYSIAAE